LLNRVESIVTHEGFVVHPTKTRVMRQSNQQEVTGIIVNQKPGIDKQALKRFRAVLFQIEKDGPGGKHWNDSRDVLASLRGFANYVYMVDPAKGAPFQRRVGALLDKYEWRPTHVQRRTASSPAAVTTAVTTDTPDELAKRPWWKLW
jgi:hypothetical protein